MSRLHTCFRLKSILGTLVMAVGLLMGSGATPASAALIGNSFTAGYYFPDTASPYAFASFTPGATNPSSAFLVINPGAEAVADVEGVTTLQIDMMARSISIDFLTILSSPTWNVATFNGVIFESSAPLQIAGASVDPATTMAGFDSSRIIIEPTRILLNWQGLSYVDGTNVTIGLTFVPLPAALGPMLAALAGVVVALRRRGARSAAPAQT